MTVTAEHSKPRRRPGVRPLYDVHYSDARRKVKRPQNWTTDDKGKAVPVGKRYEVRWIDNDGRQRSERFADRRDAQARHTALVTEFETHSHIPRERARTLVSAVAQTYVDTALAAKPLSTRTSYGSTIDRFTARFGDREVGSLVPSDVQGWVGALASGDKPLSLASRRKYVAVVRKMLDSAVRDGLIAKNPAARVDLGRERAVPENSRSIDRHEVPTRAELDAIIAAVTNPTVAAMLRFMALTGLRVGEACELRVKDLRGIKFEGTDDDYRATVKIARSVAESTDDNGARIVGLPKSGRTRTVPLGNEAYGLLKGRLHGDGAVVDLGDPEALIFPNRDGAQFRGSNINDPVLVKACEAATTRRISCHTARHYFATDALHRGVPLPVVSDWLGHADTSVTAKVYAHVVRSTSHDAAALLP